MTTIKRVQAVSLLILGLAFPLSANAQFTYTNNPDNTITITRYTQVAGEGNLTIPTYIDGLLVTGIGDGAFYLCYLNFVTIPNSVTSIGHNAFGVCEDLEIVTIGSGVTNIGDQAFVSCSFLRNINVSTNNQFYSSVEGVLFDKRQTTLIQYPIGSKAGSYTIPNSVTSIGNSAFSYCHSLTNVTIPNSVTSIGDYAFSGCIGLTSVTIPNSVTSIGNSAFSYCHSLTNVTIPNSVTSIGDYEFLQCSSLTSVTIGSGVTSIGDQAFSWCSGLTNLNVDANNQFYSSMDGALFDKTQTALIQYPSAKVATSYTLPKSVASIGDFGFGSCTSLTTVIIGSGVTNIEDSAFYGCSSLTNVTIPNSVTTIGNGAFYGCSSLTSLTIGSGVTSIDQVFWGCSGLTNINVDANNQFYSSLGGVLFDKSQTTLIQYPYSRAGSYTIPSGVITIGTNAFEWCGGLASVAIPNSVTNIEDSAFLGCLSLISVYFQGNAPRAGNTVFDYLTKWGPVFDPATIYYLPGTIGWSDTFATRSTRPYSGIAGDFVYLVNGTAASIVGYAGTNQNVAIPSAIDELPVTSIGINAFFDCHNLISVMIGGGVTNIGDQAFSQCYNLRAIDVSVDNNSFLSVHGVLFNKSQTTLIQFPVGSGATSYSIPDGVTNIGDYAFSGCGLDNITIPNSVTYIGDYVFSGCNGLTIVTIPGSVTSIGDYAFSGCFGLTSVYFKGNAPSVVDDLSVFAGDPTTVYYLPGTTGWSTNFAGLPTALWVLPYPLILTTAPSFGVQTNGFGFTISWATNIPVVVEASTTLSNPTWTPVGTNTLTSGSSYFSDQQWTSPPSRFYRVRSQ